MQRERDPGGVFGQLVTPPKVLLHTINTFHFHVNLYVDVLEQLVLLLFLLLLVVIVLFVLVVSTAACGASLAARCVFCDLHYKHISKVLN